LDAGNDLLAGVIEEIDCLELVQEFFVFIFELLPISDSVVNDLVYLLAAGKGITV
jgi:hypothetical protein